MNTRHFRLLLSAVALHGVTALAADAPLPFAEAVFTEIVNDVQVVRAGDASAVKAERNAKFRAPDLVRTGRKSRAQLTAADGTVARIGSNAVFSFDKDSRTMNLQSGSVLFHSPTGKGGGTVVTNSATASVIGTTIVVSATADGGFKMLVLEGVAKVVFPNGAVSTVNAGQMTFVLPGASVVTQKTGKGEPETKSTGATGGRPGPVLNFDLAALNTDSGLVGGFKSELPSLGKMRSALRDQRERIGEGELRATGLPILGAETGDTIILGDPTVIQQVMQLIAAKEESGLAAAARTTLVLDGKSPVPEASVFRTAVEIPTALRPAGNEPVGRYFQGLAAGDLTLTGTAFDLGFMSGRAHADVFGFQKLSLGNITFNAPAGLTSLRVGGRQVQIAQGASVIADFAGGAQAASPTVFRIESFTGADYGSVTFGNPTGDVQLVTLTGDLRMNGGAVNAEPSLGHADLTAEDGAVELAGVTVQAGPSVAVSGRTGVLLDDTSVTASHVSLTASAGGVVVRNGSRVNGFGDRSLAVAGDGVTITSSTLSTPGLAAFDARSRPFSMTDSVVNADAIRIRGDSVSLVGYAQSSPVATDGKPAPGGALDAASGLLTVDTVGDVSLRSYFHAKGNAVTVTAANLDLTDSVIESTGGVLDVNAAALKLQGGELIGTGFATINLTGSAEILTDGSVRSRTGSVSLNAGRITIDGGNLASAVVTAVNAVGEVRVKGAASVSGAGVRIGSSAGLVRLEGGSIQATGGNTIPTVGVQAAITETTLPPVGIDPAQGVIIAGAGVTLDEGVTVNAGAGVAELAAVTKSGTTETLYDLSITHADITANGVNLKGAGITIVGTGGSEDANGNITFGGTIDATGRALTVSGTSLSLRDFTALTGASGTVTLSGDITMHLASIKATAGVLDVNGHHLDLDAAELDGAGGLNIRLLGNAIIGRADLASGGAQVTLEAASIDSAGTVTAATDFIALTGSFQKWSQASVTANHAKFAGVGLAIADSITFADVDLTVASMLVAADTVELLNVRVGTADPAVAGLPEVTLRSTLGVLNARAVAVAGDGQNVAITEPYAPLNGHVNIDGLLLKTTTGDTDAVANALVWSPEDNLGDASAPVHILKFGAQDFRGPDAKLNYARGIDFTEATLTRFNPALPSGNVFRQGAPAMLDYADYGLTGAEVLPSIDGGGNHSLFEVKGLLARSITLNGDVNLDLTMLNPIAQESNERMDIVVTNDFRWNGAVSLHGDTGSHRRLEVRARNLVAAAGSALTFDLPYDFAYPRDQSALMLAALNTLAVNGTLTSQVTISNPAGSIEMGSALGDVDLKYAKVVAGFQSVDTVSTFPIAGQLQEGSLNLSTFATTSKITVIGSQLLAHSASADHGVEIEGIEVNLSGVQVRAESRSMMTAGSEPLYTSDAGTGPLGGITDVTAGQYKSTGAIRIHGTALVKIQGGTLAAADVGIGVNSRAPAGTLLESIEMDGTRFVMAESQPVFDLQTSQWSRSTGIAMEARTISLRNLDFPDRVQVRLRSQDGVLNIDTGAGSLFGAVNFRDVRIRTAGDTQNPAGATTLLNTSANINSKVWVESGKVYFNKALDTNTTGASAASGAAIHIQSAGAANQQGLHGSSF